MYATGVFRIHERYCYAQMEPGKCCLTSESGTRFFQSDIVTQILNLLDGQSLHQKQLIEKFQQEGSLFEGMHTLSWLEKEGYIIQTPQSHSLPASPFWEARGLNPDQVAQALASHSIQCISVQGVERDSLKMLAHDTGLREGDSPSLVVVLCNYAGGSALETLNTKFLKLGQPWILIQVSARQPFVGPVFRPDLNGPCWQCLAHRIHLHDRDEQYFRSIVGANCDLPRPSQLPLLHTVQILSTALIEVVRWLVMGLSQPLSSTLECLDLVNNNRSSHHLVKRPQCPACGNHPSGKLTPQPIKITEASICYRVGGYRVEIPEKTLATYQHLVSPLTGIVPKLEPCNLSEDAPTYNFFSGRNPALSPASPLGYRLYEQSASGGKGSTKIQAKVGALAEAIERYSLFQECSYPQAYGPLNSIPDAIHPQQCLGFSERQYAERNTINRLKPAFHALVPLPFDEKEATNWTRVYSLTHKKFKSLPSGFCFPKLEEDQSGIWFAYPDSNGAAAGNTIEEAILQGFLELVERDAAAIWWYNRIPRPGIDLEACPEPYVATFVQYLARRNRNLHVLDLTHDLEIPVFAAISYNAQPNHGDQILFSFGAHLEPKIALERALSEMNQLLPALEDHHLQNPDADGSLVDWIRNQQIGDHPHLMPSGQVKCQLNRDFKSQSCNNMKEAIDICIAAAAKRHLEILVLDITQPDVGMPVARVIVPGMRHFWRRTAPGRLYTVPVQMGWLDRPYSETELNPIGIYI